MTWSNKTLTDGFSNTLEAVFTDSSNIYNDLTQSPVGTLHVMASVSVVARVPYLNTITLSTSSSYCGSTNPFVFVLSYQGVVVSSSF